MMRLLLVLLGLGWTASALAQSTVPRIGYEIFVRSFADSNGDGIGDLDGITARLGYLSDLGVEVIWLTPVCVSPSYHKYDVVDYLRVDPEHGTLEDYRELVEAAHSHGIKVVKDLVLNHSSELHPWFLAAKQGPENPYRDYYVWLSPKVIDSMGIAIREISPDSWEVYPWHFVAEGEPEKYYGLFSGVMPDLNLDNPVVRAQLYQIGKFWLEEIGVDGFRLDAAKHTYPEWEAEKAHAFWEEFRQEMEESNEAVLLIGEVYADAEIVAPFFKGLHGNFNIQLSHLLPHVVAQERDSQVVETLLHAHQLYGEASKEFVDVTILSNHDQNRVGSVLEGDTAKLKVAANLLLTLPGLPFLYYGEEIGMLGKKPDPEIREPFLWVAAGEKWQTSWQEATHSTPDQVRPLAAQQQDPHSVYQHYKRMIQLRTAHPALAQVQSPNLIQVASQSELIVFQRPHPDGSVLVLHNLSGESQAFHSELLAEFSEVIYSQKQVTKRKNGSCKLAQYSVLVLGESKE
ncbi:MAG: alpha-amylase family glycosyl hydrolase [Bacteroidota bacterium]